MGQYYFIVNLDKKQYLYPRKFGDGLKLMEFGSSSMGTLLALTALLADGNGRGRGDIFSSKYQKQEKRYIDKKRKTFPLAEKYNDPLIGSWAGDRIVIAGDYADGLKFIEDVPEEQLEKIEKEAFTEGYQKAGEVTLFHYAGNHFEDISEKIIATLQDAGEEIKVKDW